MDEIEFGGEATEDALFTSKVGKVFSVLATMSIIRESVSLLVDGVSTCIVLGGMFGGILAPLLFEKEDAVVDDLTHLWFGPWLYNRAGLAWVTLVGPWAFKFSAGYLVCAGLLRILNWLWLGFWLAVEAWPPEVPFQADFSIVVVGPN